MLGPNQRSTKRSRSRPFDSYVVTVTFKTPCTSRCFASRRSPEASASLLASQAASCVSSCSRGNTFIDQFVREARRQALRDFARRHSCVGSRDSIASTQAKRLVHIDHNFLARLVAGLTFIEREAGKWVTTHAVTVEKLHCAE